MVSTEGVLVGVEGAIVGVGVGMVLIGVMVIGAVWALGVVMGKGGLMGNVIPKEARAADGAMGPVMIGKVRPRYPGAEEK
jgi:hypothetical protein